MLLILLHIKAFYRRTPAEVVQKHVADDNVFHVMASLRSKDSLQYCAECQSDIAPACIDITLACIEQDRIHVRTADHSRNQSVSRQVAAETRSMLAVLMLRQQAICT